jgi:hypothetical protein
VAGREWQDIDECIGLSFSSCHYGGKRPWFVCPMAECGRAVAVLYLSPVSASCAASAIHWPMQVSERIELNALYAGVRRFARDWEGVRS